MLFKDSKLTTTKMPGTAPPVTFYGPKEVQLYNGIHMPIFGLGTSHSGGYSHSAVVYALKDCGYKLIDTAKRYGCEELLSHAIKESEVPIEDLFLTTKLWPTDYGLSTTRKAFQGSMKRLGVDYIDLFMLHWPICPSWCLNKAETLKDTWRVLELLYDEGLCHAIGVSNYDVHHLEELMETSSVIPHVNQVEFHPFQNPWALRQYCNENKIQFEGYCPLGKGKILSEKSVLKVAQHCNCTPAQVLIRWSIQNGVLTIPKSTKKERVKENSQVFDFEISKEDMDLLNSLHDGRRIVDISSIQEKIDSRLPDGYKLHLKSPEDKFSYRNHS